MTRRVSDRLDHDNDLVFAQVQGVFQASPINTVADYRAQTR
jgi:hypothetical protein